jgi:hypothetical protein
MMTLEQSGFTQLKTYVTQLTFYGDGQKDGVSHPDRKADITQNCPYLRLQFLFWWIRGYNYLFAGATTRSTETGYRNGDFSYEDDFLTLLKDDFDTHEDAFLKLYEDAFLKLLVVRTLSSNLLAQSIDVLKKSLHYICLRPRSRLTETKSKVRNEFNLLPMEALLSLITTPSLFAEPESGVS